MHNEMVDSPKFGHKYSCIYISSWLVPGHHLFDILESIVYQPGIISDLPKLPKVLEMYSYDAH